VATAIDTARVTGRRHLHFSSLDDILADTELLARCPELRTLGNWSAGQVFTHLAVVMNKSIDGFTARPPATVRFLLRLLLKRRFLTRPMAPGFKLPARAQAEIGPPPVGAGEALEDLRRAIDRLRAEERRSPHPVFGPLTRAEWDQLHCRHAELHLSFLVPVA
jgi:hypothetical protein